MVGNIWLQLGHELSVKCTNDVLEWGGHENTDNPMGTTELLPAHRR